jgi:ADP-ribose pyrophosphatase YjhB (NUDIX family)
MSTLIASEGIEIPQLLPAKPPRYPTRTQQGRFSFEEVNVEYAALTMKLRRQLLEAMRIVDDGCPHAKETEVGWWPTETWVGAVVYVRSTQCFQLQRRDSKTKLHPWRLCNWGGGKRSTESATGGTRRELLEELNLDIYKPYVDRLGLKVFLEARIPTPTIRCLSGIMLWELPKELRVGEGDGMESIGLDEIENEQRITMLSREDLIYVRSLIRSGAI